MVSGFLLQIYAYYYDCHVVDDDFTITRHFHLGVHRLGEKAILVGASDIAFFDYCQVF